MSAKKKAFEHLAALLEQRGFGLRVSHPRPNDVDGETQYGDGYDAESRGRGQGMDEAAKLIKETIEACWPSVKPQAFR